jgi:hypothetical protein
MIWGRFLEFARAGFLLKRKVLSLRILPEGVEWMIGDHKVGDQKVEKIDIMCFNHL